MTATYDYWRRALQGDFGAVHDGHPQPGFYRHTLCSKVNVPWCPVAIWPDHDGKMLAMKHIYISTQPLVVPADDVWTFVCNNPISEDAYRAVAERGEMWPSGSLINKRKDNDPDC